MTRNGVCYNFFNSPYIYECNGIVYVFSSQLHKEKFKKRKGNHRKQMVTRLFSIFHIHMDATTASDILLYQKTETRGFLIRQGGDIFTCPQEILLDGEKLIKISLPILSDSSMAKSQES